MTDLAKLADPIKARGPPTMQIFGLLFLIVGMGLLTWSFLFDVGVPIEGVPGGLAGSVANADLLGIRAMIFGSGALLFLCGVILLAVETIRLEISERA